MAEPATGAGVDTHRAAQGAVPDIVTQLQEQVALLSSMYFNYTGGIASAVPPVSVAGEPVRLPPGVVALPHDLKLLAENIAAAHDKLDELADALPLRQPQEAQLRNVEHRRAELTDSGTGLEAQLADAEAALSAVRQSLRVATDALFAEEAAQGSMRTS